MLFLKIILGLVILYLLLALVVYWVQEWFFFHPEKLPRDFLFQYGLPFEELFFETEKGVEINALHFKVSKPKGVILYFKGNTKSIKGWSKFARDFMGAGYDVVMFDYRGFGKSIGKRTEEGMYKDSQHVYDWLKTRYPETQIIIYGRSMGSGFAAKTAAENLPKMLILDAPYYSFSQLIRKYYLPFLPANFLVKYKIHTHRFIPHISCPIYIFHGTKDWIIPIRYGLQLIRLIGSQQGTFIRIQGAGHNNLRNFPAYYQNLYRILGFVE